VGRPRFVQAIALAVALALAPACADGDDDGEDDTVTPPSDPGESPEAVTEALMVLWQDRDRAAADRLASDQALDTLFAITPPNESIEVEQCLDEPELPGSKTCRAQGGGQTVLVTVRQDGESERWRAIAILPIR
jgi:hypothetical protein